MRLQIIVGSTRRGRAGLKVARWALLAARASAFDHAEMVDLADYPLSFMDEPESPQYNEDRAPAPSTQRWLDKLIEADAYLIVSPEYNRSVPAVLKNALDHVAFEMSGKPMSSITYGSSGGAQAHASLKIIMPTLEAAVLPSSVFLFPQQVAAIGEDGEVAQQDDRAAAALTGTIEQLHQYAIVLGGMRDSLRAS